MLAKRLIKSNAICILVLVLFFAAGLARAADDEKPVIVIHGGAGVEEGLSAEAQEEYKKSLNEALLAAFKVWQKGGQAVEVVEAAVKSLEDCPLFNAGKGAVFTHDGKNELDAAVMDGRDRKAGSVAGVTVIKNPISAAIAVMQKSPHVMLVGDGANQFAREHGLEIVDPKYFWTKKRWDDLQKKLEETKSKTQIPIKNAVPVSIADSHPDHKFGTVGAVVRDSQGNLAAGTSTGGLTNKRWGRVGDSPVIGAGTFADNSSCAVSCTGEGEWFIRFTVAGDLAARVKYNHDSVKTAAEDIIHIVLGPGHGEGGLIALDRNGNYAMSYNSPGMFRGYITADGKAHAFVY